jgi:hypothetical protein
VNARSLHLGAAISLLACSCTLLPPTAGDFEAGIERIQQATPGSPSVLSAQLAYADFLLNAAPGPCAQRLGRAQQLLDSVDGNPKVHAMFPDGWARATGLEYPLHLALAACGPETVRAAELSTAAATARRGVELYRSAFDYHSMVMMQADVADALHQLGDETGAMAALETALDMDRELGFQDDAREHDKLLLTWKGEPADDAQIDRLMQGFPQRRAVLTFGWRSSDASITVESRRVSLHDGQLSSSHAADTLLASIRASGDQGGWTVSHTHRLGQYNPGVWPATEGSQAPAGVFVPGAPPPADFKVSATGEFGGVGDQTDVFAAHLLAKTQQLVRTAAPSGDAADSLTSKALDRTGVTLSAGMLEGSTAESYQLETAMWIGAAVEQGVWYETVAPLTLSGLPGVIAPHRIEFAFTRMVPCTRDAPAPTCVELVLHASPDPQALAQLVEDARISAYSGSRDLRIVTDPATLLPYVREEHLEWYASGDNQIQGSDLGSEQLVSTTSYGVDSPASAASVSPRDRGPP